MNELFIRVHPSILRFRKGIQHYYVLNVGNRSRHPQIDCTLRQSLSSLDQHSFNINAHDRPFHYNVCNSIDCNVHSAVWLFVFWTYWRSVWPVYIINTFGLLGCDSIPIRIFHKSPNVQVCSVKLFVYYKNYSHYSRLCYRNLRKSSGLSDSKLKRR